mmetsp:Transcript_56481/g.112131  ORF Transcript_56481/g.112131 Transcript_56481/m.112131 type:complete len:229 (+) Transcript_56481:1930-2616(+)
MNFVLDGGIVVPIDSRPWPDGAVAPENLPATLTRDKVVLLARFGFQFWASLRLLLPAWAEWETTAFTQEPSTLIHCVDTVHVFNRLVELINTTSDFSSALASIGDGHGVLGWLTSWVCSTTPWWCTAGSEIVSLSLSATGQVTVTAPAGSARLDGSEGPPTVSLPPSIPPSLTDDVGAFSAGAIAGISVGSCFCCFAVIVLGLSTARKRIKSVQVRVQPTTHKRTAVQ